MKKLAIILSILALSACSTTEKISDLPPIPSDATPREAASYVTASCLGFAKAGFKNGHGTELDIFNSCMNKAIAIIEKTTETTDE
jgi:hypothetical protein